MKCPNCDGRGKTTEYDGLRKFWCDYKCDVCDGKGIVEPMTNEEYLRSCNTEQLADVIADFYLLGFTHGHNQMDITSRTKWVEWLKQPHTKE